MNQDSAFETHTVENQPQPLAPYNYWTNDSLLQHAVRHSGVPTPPNVLNSFGEIAGEVLADAGEQANNNKPVFHPFDRYGRRIDKVDFHPSYHQLMGESMKANVHNYSWLHPHQTGAHVIRAALLFMQCQADAGTTCPLTMTHAAYPALKYGQQLPAYWLDKLVNGSYDPRCLPAKDKSGITLGMGMTEKQGGSDVRSNTTTATQQADGSYKIIGHKFFFSAPMSDGHLILAQAEGGLSCFLLPRICEDGSLNKVRIQRLKDKLGDWSNASSEVEFTGATAYLLGSEGRGISVILDMVSLTRLDCMIGSTAIMRQALVQATHHVTYRNAFGKPLIHQPLMQNVLADMTIECSAHLALTMRVAQAIDAADDNEEEAAFARIATAVGKYWVCKRAPVLINEAQECLGGIGYVEENILPRLYRQAPLNSIWEGSGNVQCLDVLRALSKEPATKNAIFAVLAQAAGKNPHFDQFVDALRHQFADTENLEIRSRLLTERTALALQGALLLAHYDSQIAATFCETRLAQQHGYTFGTLPGHTPFTHIIELGQLAR